MAAQAVWKGSLAIGLVNIGVNAYKAADDPAEQTSKKWLHSACKLPIAQKKTCATCKVADIPMADIINGVPDGNGGFVLVTADEIAALRAPSSSTIAIEAFVPAASIDALYLDTTYFLAPATAASAASLALMRDAMRAKGVVFTGRVSLYGREHPVAIRPLGRVLAMQLLRTLDELRSPAALPFYAELGAPVDGQQAELAAQLVAMYGGAFDPNAYEDQYVAAFQALVAAKKAGQPAPVLEAVAPTAVPTDLMAALALSLAARVPPAPKVPLRIVDVPVKAAKPAKAKAAKPVKVEAA